jgi:hypothetical protein
MTSGCGSAGDNAGEVLVSDAGSCADAETEHIIKIETQAFHAEYDLLPIFGRF